MADLGKTNSQETKERPEGIICIAEWRSSERRLMFGLKEPEEEDNPSDVELFVIKHGYFLQNTVIF